MNPQTNPIRVAVVDDHAIVRQGLRNLLLKRQFDIVGEASCGHEAIKVAGDVNPDVMLLDIRMKDCDGLTALPDIKQASPDTKVIILTTYSNPTYFSQAVQRGACGYLLKDAEPEDIVQAIYFAASKQHLFDPELLAQATQIDAHTAHTSPLGGFQLEQDHDPTDMTRSTLYETLSEREHEVLHLLMDGLSNPDIAKKLHLSLPTVKTHVAHILRKLDAKDRTQAVVIAIKHGLVT